MGGRPYLWEIPDILGKPNWSGLPDFLGTPEVFSKLLAHYLQFKPIPPDLKFFFSYLIFSRISIALSGFQKGPLNAKVSQSFFFENLHLWIIGDENSHMRAGAKNTHK